MSPEASAALFSCRLLEIWLAQAGRLKFSNPSAVATFCSQSRPIEHEPNHVFLANPNELSHIRQPQSLVELTGIEPVASWLQTRRSPS
jgi:hypothetical protein